MSVGEVHELQRYHYSFGSRAEEIRRQMTLAGQQQLKTPPPKWAVPVVHADADVAAAVRVH